MLSESKLVAFVATARPEDARHFYESALGLTLVEDGPYALVFNANGTTVRVQKVQAVSPAGYTAIGWEVDNIEVAMQQLKKQGVSFERYEGLPQNEEGIWRTPDGSSVAWFRDPDGNILSLCERQLQQRTTRPSS